MNGIVERVDHTEVSVRDVDETTDFYVNVLGFKLLRRIRIGDAGASQGLACVTLGDFMIEILPARPESLDEPVDQYRVGARMIALRVKNMAKAVEYFQSKGVEVSRPPRPGNAFIGLRGEIKDPNDMSIELREWQGGDSINNDAWQPSNSEVTRTA